MKCTWYTCRGYIGFRDYRVCWFSEEGLLDRVLQLLACPFQGREVVTYDIGIMENKMKTTVVCWGYSGIMENKMEATIVTG